MTYDGLIQHLFYLNSNNSETICRIFIQFEHNILHLKAIVQN